MAFEHGQMSLALAQLTVGSSRCAAVVRCGAAVPAHAQPHGGVVSSLKGAHCVPALLGEP